MKVLRPLRQLPTSLRQQRRHLSIHEYQSQNLLRDASVLVPRGHLARTPAEAAQHAKTLGSGPCVLKSQILAGGRGKGHFIDGAPSGIQVAKDASEVEAMASGMLDHRLVTKQTKAEGLLVDKLYVAEKVPYVKEFYLSITIDREAARPTLIVSREGGMNIEAAAEKDPSSVAKLGFDYIEGLSEEDVKIAARTLGLDKDEGEVGKVRDLLTKLVGLFKSKDATLIEINPLVLTEGGELLCLDAKFSFDNAAAPRQKELFALETENKDEATDESEVDAQKSGLVYVRLDGNIGNVVNGAGLAMATNDAIAYYGGKSANFLDAGGQATKETMVDAFRIILRDDRVKCICVNIYGGQSQPNMRLSSWQH